ncbi:hypothetical protein DPMN_045965 [Dreissena polymorpha]|uniref:Uncharacterized protein n=1 Tax=Dreissena polymorpha TaxID=45954 RepID=A0A9D4HXT5_DREPO|nr:hypothetical protein DPMN_045965 [Dreissena polymorpha]
MIFVVIHLFHLGADRDASHYHPHIPLQTLQTQTRRPEHDAVQARLEVDQDPGLDGPRLTRKTAPAQRSAGKVSCTERKPFNAG